MDLVKIGYEINANGLKQANIEIDQLLTKVSKLDGRKLSVNTDGVDKAQSKTTQEIDKTTKALERQKLVGDYLGKGLDKTTANTLANFKLVGASTKELDAMFNLLGNNKGLVGLQKELEQLERQQRRTYEEGAKQYRKYVEASSKPLGDGILATPERVNKDLENLKKFYTQQETIAKKSNDQMLAMAQNRSDKQLQILKKEQERVRQENLKTEYLSKGYSKTQAGQLASFQMNTTNPKAMQDFKRAMDATKSSADQLTPSLEKASQAQNGFLSSGVMGIAKYALLSAAIYGVISAVTGLITATVTLADEYTSIQNRMKLYIKDADTLRTVNNDLVKMSIENNVGLRETATLYARLAPSMQKMGADTKQITAVVDAFGKSMRIGGATAMEAASATIQFSQAMAAGKLQGDEFRSISEASPRFLRAIAEGAGIAAEKLKEMSSAGALTTQVIASALLKEYPKLIKENAALGMTLEQGVNAIVTAFTAMVGQFNEGAKITTSVGTMFANLATSMFDFAQGAKAAGSDFRQVMSVVGDVLKGLSVAVGVAAIAMTSKFVVGLAQGVVGLIQYNRWLLTSMATTQQTSKSNLALAATIEAVNSSLTKVKGAANSAVAAMGGWAGIALTIAGVAAAYIALQPSVDDTNKKMAEQADAVFKTKEEWAALNNEQRKNASFKLEIDTKEAQKQVDDLNDKFIQLFQQNYASTQRDAMGDLQLANPKNLEILDKLTKGTIDYATAVREAQAIKPVSDDSLNKMFELEKQYNEASKTQQKMITSSKNLGVEVQAVGNKAQNSAVGVEKMDNAVVNLGFSADDTAKKLQGLKQSFRDMADNIQNSLNLQIRLGINQSLADKATRDIDDLLSARKAKMEKETQAVADLQAKANKMAAGAEKDKVLKTIENSNRIIAENKKLMESDRVYYENSMSAELKLAQAKQDAQDAYTKSLKPQRERQPKKTPEEKATANFEAQVRNAVTYNNLLADGLDINVARIASQEKYNVAYGKNLEMAEKLARLDILTSKREAHSVLNKRAKDSQEVIKLIQAGIPKELAKQSVTIGFKMDEEGFEYLNNLLNQTIKELSFEYTIAAKEQNTINNHLERGATLEEAKLLSMISQNVQLNESEKLLMQFTLDSIRLNDLEQARLNILQEINKANHQATVFAQGYQDDLANIMADERGVTQEQALRLVTARNIAEKLKEQSAEMEKQKTLQGMLDTVDFSVFEDFADPFKSGLESLNSMVFGVDQLKTKYQEMYSFLDGQAAIHAGNEAELTNIQKVRTQVQVAETKELTNLRNKGIASTLSFAKGLFKEESKGYKVLSGLEKAYQASQIAFALWEKKESITSTALELANKAKEFIATQTLNVAKGVGAVLEQAKGDPYTAFGRMASMAAIVASLGVIIGGAITSGGSSGSYISYENKGTGTVFGDKEKGSESISKSIDILKDNSDKMLPLTSQMLRSVRAIENGMKGVANLVIRGANNGTDLAGNIVQGLQYSDLGKAIYSIADNSIVGAISGFATGNMLANGVAMALGTGVATGIASIAFPIIGTLMGAAFGSTLGKLTSKLFYSKKTVTASGLYLPDQNLGSILEDGANLKEYADIEKKKRKLFKKSTEYYTDTKDASEEVSNQFTLIFKGMYDSITAAAKVFGDDTLKDVEERLSNYTVSMGKLNLKDKTGEEIQQILANAFGAEADKMARYAIPFLEDFQQVGEGYFETLMRVSSGIEKATYMTQWLNVEMIKWQDIANTQGDVTAEIIRQSVILAYTGKEVEGGFVDLINTFDGTGEEMFQFVKTLRQLQDAIIATGKDSDYLTNTMILGAGGADKLSSGLQAYFDMLSPAEQAAELTRRMTEQFAAFGQTLPSGIQGYKDLIASIDISTEEGQKLYGQLISLAPEFNTLQDALEKANSEVNKLAKSLRDLAEQARANRGVTESPRNLEYLRAEYQRNAALAANGDVKAAEEMLRLGKDLMDVSKMYAKSYEEYMRDLALIQGTAEDVANKIESGDVTTTNPNDPLINNTLPDLSETGTGGDGTINTSAKETEVQIAQMREDMVIAMTTVAKYIQRLDAKFDRWDDGVAMNVRPVQDPLDAPIKVKPV